MIDLIQSMGGIEWALLGAALALIVAGCVEKIRELS